MLTLGEKAGAARCLTEAAVAVLAASAYLAKLPGVQAEAVSLARKLAWLREEVRNGAA